MAGIYADEGISGTSLKKRTQFNKMITACKRGHIDLIITKSLSRFARNTVDCLDTVRLLKANGIGVYFEKENINTLTESSEFLITLFSGFAQAESESLSKNVAWGKQKSAEAGKVTFQYKKMLGYRKGADGQPEIVPEEAEIIRRIYHRYLDGCTLGQIKRELDEDGVPTAQGVERWSPSIIHNILTNEKYIGDALLQKTYVTDCINKKVKKNRGGEQPSGHCLKGPVQSGAAGDDAPVQQAEGAAKERENGTWEILRQIRSDRTAGVRRVRLPLQAGHMGQKWEKAHRMALRLPAGVRYKILPALPDTG